MKILLIIIVLVASSCSTLDVSNKDQPAFRHPANEGQDCKGIVENIFSFFKKKEAPKKSGRIERLTRLRLSGAQEEQEKSILQDFKVAQEAVDQANALLLKEDVPEEVYVVFNENMAKEGAYVRLFEINLTNAGKKEAIENKSIIIHEYFHLILNKEISNHSPEFKKIFEDHLVELKKGRVKSRIGEMEYRIKQLGEFKKQTKFIIGTAKNYGDWGESAFTKKNVEYIIEDLKRIEREDLIKKYKRLNVENIEDLKKDLEQNLVEIDNKMSHLSNKLSQVQSENNGKGEEELFEEIKNINPSLTSFYTIAIHELYADLGAVLTLKNPASIKDILNSPLRDFTNLRTLDSCYTEYLRERQNSMHTFFAYLRGVLWNQYFNKVPMAERETKWPLMMKKLANDFANEMVNNPDLPNTPNTPLLDFEEANKHLEKIIQNSLEEFI